VGYIFNVALVEKAISAVNSGDIPENDSVLFVLRIEKILDNTSVIFCQCYFVVQRQLPLHATVVIPDIIVLQLAYVSHLFPKDTDLVLEFFVLRDELGPMLLHSPELGRKPLHPSGITSLEPSGTISYSG